MDIEIKDSYAIITAELKATADGHLYPHLHNFYMDISKSKLYDDQSGREFLYRQFFNLYKHIMQSAYNLFGANLINQNLYEQTKRLLND